MDAQKAVMFVQSGIVSTQTVMEQTAFKPDPLLAAKNWRSNNPHAYAQLYEWALEDKKNGSRPSIGLYAELLRRPHFANKLRLRHSDHKFLLNNNLRAELARLLNDQCDLGFPTRHAKGDDW